MQPASAREFLCAFEGFSFLSVPTGVVSVCVCGFNDSRLVRHIPVKAVMHVGVLNVPPFTHLRRLPTSVPAKVLLPLLHPPNCSSFLSPALLCLFLSFDPFSIDYCCAIVCAAPPYPPHRSTHLTTLSETYSFFSFAALSSARGRIERHTDDGDECACVCMQLFFFYFPQILVRRSEAAAKPITTCSPLLSLRLSNIICFFQRLSLPPFL